MLFVFQKSTTVPTRPWAPSSMPTGGRGEVLSVCLFERFDVSKSRVQARLAPVGPCRAAAGHACGMALEVKEGLARQALFPVRRAEAALISSSARADAKPVFTWQWQPDFHLAPLRLTSRVSPRRRGTFFCFAKKESTQRKGDPQRIETPPQPCHSGRGRNLRRANVAPLRTADRLTPCAACPCRLALMGVGLRRVYSGNSKRLWDSNPQTGQIKSALQQTTCTTISGCYYRTNTTSSPHQACRRVAGARF